MHPTVHRRAAGKGGGGGQLHQSGRLPWVSLPSAGEGSRINEHDLSLSLHLSGGLLRYDKQALQSQPGLGSHPPSSFS